MPPFTTNPAARRPQHLLRASRLGLFALFSVALTSLVCLSAWHQNKHFYSAGIYLSRSGASLLALINFGALATLGLGKVVQRFIFGPLRHVEVEHLYERSWVAVTELLLAMTVFRDEFDARFTFFFLVLLFLKAFHWITADRVDFMEHTPTAPFLSHLRLQSFMAALLAVDLYLVFVCMASYWQHGPSMMILFGFEYTILASTMVVTALKYILHAVDARWYDHQWEAKSVWVFYLDLVHDFFKLVNYLTFLGVVLTTYGLPLHILRDLYLTLRSFLLKVRDLVRYRRATRNMDARYPSATPDDLARLSDRTCIICREDMYAPGEPRPDEPDEIVPPVAAATGGVGAGTPPAPFTATATHGTRRSQVPKKLPCGHVFHFGCLRSWLERQQSCPTCRRSVLETDNPVATAPAAAVPAAAAGVPPAAPVRAAPAAPPAVPAPPAAAVAPAPHGAVARAAPAPAPGPVPALTAAGAPAPPHAAPDPNGYLTDDDRPLLPRPTPAQLGPSSSSSSSSSATASRRPSLPRRSRAAIFNDLADLLPEVAATPAPPELETIISAVLAQIPPPPPPPPQAQVAAVVAPRDLSDEHLAALAAQARDRATLERQVEALAVVQGQIRDATREGAEVL
ncbi:E3 ubiquitin-protein ligase hrd1 [Allomyces javanicus]|nr:E3 ubiquitin-protein ligase hrd1 [Allomyces javanicus]